MLKINSDIVKFLDKQGFVLVATIDASGHIHTAAKGIVGIAPEGKVFLIDLYFHNTYENIKKNNTISITSVDGEKFKGYSLKGKAKIVQRNEISEQINDEWERRIINRISSRVIGGVQSGSHTKEHFELDLPPHPKYLIEIDVEEVVDLAPPQKQLREPLIA